MLFVAFALAYRLPTTRDYPRDFPQALGPYIPDESNFINPLWTGAITGKIPASWVIPYLSEQNLSPAQAIAMLTPTISTALSLLRRESNKKQIDWEKVADAIDTGLKILGDAVHVVGGIKEIFSNGAELDDAVSRIEAAIASIPVEAIQQAFRARLETIKARLGLKSPRANYGPLTPAQAIQLLSPAISTAVSLFTRRPAANLPWGTIISTAGKVLGWVSTAVDIGTAVKDIFSNSIDAQSAAAAKDVVARVEAILSAVPADEEPEAQQVVRAQLASLKARLGQTNSANFWSPIQTLPIILPAIQTAIDIATRRAANKIPWGKVVEGVATGLEMLGDAVDIVTGIQGWFKNGVDLAAAQDVVSRIETVLSAVPADEEPEAQQALRAKLASLKARLGVQTARSNVELTPAQALIHLKPAISEAITLAMKQPRANIAWLPVLVTAAKVVGWVSTAVDVGTAIYDAVKRNSLTPDAAAAAKDVVSRIETVLSMVPADEEPEAQQAVHAMVESLKARLGQTNSIPWGTIVSGLTRPVATPIMAPIIDRVFDYITRREANKIKWDKVVDGVEAGLGMLGDLVDIVSGVQGWFQRSNKKKYDFDKIAGYVDKGLDMVGDLVHIVGGVKDWFSNEGVTPAEAISRLEAVLLAIPADEQPEAQRILRARLQALKSRLGLTKQPRANVGPLTPVQALLLLKPAILSAASIIDRQPAANLPWGTIISTAGKVLGWVSTAVDIGTAVKDIFSNSIDPEAALLAKDAVARVEAVLSMVPADEEPEAQEAVRAQIQLLKARIGETNDANVPWGTIVKGVATGLGMLSDVVDIVTGVQKFFNNGLVAPKDLLSRLDLIIASIPEGVSPEVVQSARARLEGIKARLGAY